MKMLKRDDNHLRWLADALIITCSLIWATYSIYADTQWLVNKFHDILRQECKGWKPEHVDALCAAVSQAFKGQTIQLTKEQEEKFLQDFRRYVKENIARGTKPHEMTFVKPETMVAYLSALLEWRVEEAVRRKPITNEEAEMILQQLTELAAFAVKTAHTLVKKLSTKVTELVERALKENALEAMLDFMHPGLKRPLTEQEKERVKMGLSAEIPKLVKEHELVTADIPEDVLLDKETKFAKDLAISVVILAAFATLPPVPKKLDDAFDKVNKELEESIRKRQQMHVQEFRHQFVFDILGQSLEKEEQMVFLVNEGFTLLHLLVFGYPPMSF